MKHVQIILRQTSALVMAGLLVFAAPAPVFADAVTDPVSAAIAAPTSNGTSSPTGVAAGTYHYNETTGLWENDHYTWNPTTKDTLPKDSQIYVYNPQTGFWDAQIWQYHEVSGAYSLDTVTVTTPPAGAATQGGPAPAPVILPTDPGNVGSTIVPAAGPAVAPSQLPDGTATTTNTPVLGTIDTTSGATLNSVIQSSALSGNGLISNNTTAGNVTTGNAASSANILNLLQSSASLAGSGVAMFTTNIVGDVTGDLLIDPAALMQPAAISQYDLGKLSLTSSQTGSINNNVKLSAVSGNALADNNRDVGNVTTGNAAAVANVMNMINSIVAANQSFLGVVNIYGNYIGDIVVPTDSLSSLLASNGASTNMGSQASTNTTTNTQINNNVDLSATSGNATATNNRDVGTVTTGDAMTKLTILNLTGHQVNAANSLLVFVNVLGSWIGVIMDAPAGTTAAALTSNATQAATAATAASMASATSMNGTTDNTITNNITAVARSGNAAATDNTTAGNVTSGKASASANIANIFNSNFSLSNWFGILFINVFGMWHGNFGTAKPPLAAGVPGTTTGTPASSTASGPAPQIFRFTRTSRSTPLGLESVAPSDVGQGLQSSTSDGQSQVLADTTSKPAITLSKPSTNQDKFSLAFLPIIAGLTGFAFLGGERVRSIRRRLAR